MIDFEKLTEQELFEIWDAANSYEWCELLGEKPDEFDSLPIDKKVYQFWIRRTKSDYTVPIFVVVDSLLTATQKEEFIKSKMTNMQKFLQLWLKAPGGIGKYPVHLLKHFSKTDSYSD